MMTRFQELLTESKKTYNFKIGIAGELPEGCEDSIKTCLEKYSVASMSKGKRTPIQERPLDFPQLENTEVTYYEVELNYPSTQSVLQEYIGQCCNIDQAYIIVRNPDEMQEKYQEMPEDTTYETKLTQEDMGGESGQDSVGENRVMDLLKELEKARKEREHDPSAAAPEAK
jgi:phosphoketolase